MSSQSQYRRKLFQCLMFAIFSAPLCLSPLTQCLQLRILCSDSASALCSVNEPSKVSQCPEKVPILQLSWIFANKTNHQL